MLAQRKRKGSEKPKKTNIFTNTPKRFDVSPPTDEKNYQRNEYIQLKMQHNYLQTPHKIYVVKFMDYVVCANVISGEKDPSCSDQARNW